VSVNYLSMTISMFNLDNPPLYTVILLLVWWLFYAFVLFCMCFYYICINRPQCVQLLTNMYLLHDSIENIKLKKCYICRPFLNDKNRQLAEAHARISLRF